MKRISSKRIKATLTFVDSRRPEDKRNIFAALVSSSKEFRETTFPEIKRTKGGIVMKGRNND